MQFVVRRIAFRSAVFDRVQELRNGAVKAFARFFSRLQKCFETRFDRAEGTEKDFILEGKKKNLFFFLT